MKSTILIATNRKSGETVLLSGEEVPFSKQQATYEKLASVVNDEYSNLKWVDTRAGQVRKSFQFLTKSEEAAKAKKTAADEKLDELNSPRAKHRKLIDEQAKAQIQAGKKAQDELDARTKVNEENLAATTEEKAKADAESAAEYKPKEPDAPHSRRPGDKTGTHHLSSGQDIVSDKEAQRRHDKADKK